MDLISLVYGGTGFSRCVSFHDIFRRKLVWVQKLLSILVLYIQSVHVDRILLFHTKQLESIHVGKFVTLNGTAL